MGKRITFPMGGEGFYRIGGIIFENGVAEVEEISHTEQELLAMIGAEIDDVPAEAPDADDDSRPAAVPEYRGPVPDLAKPETPAEPETPETPTPQGDVEDAQAHEITTTDSDTDGSESLTAGRHAEDAPA